MTLEEMIKDSGLEPKTINKIIKNFQKAMVGQESLRG